MLDIVLTGRFKKDLKIIEKRGYRLELLTAVTNRIAQGEVLEPRYKDHALAGDYIGYRQCNVTTDWLLVYQIQEETLVLVLSRTFTHNDPF